MAALLHELLVDYAYGKLSIIERCDIEAGLSSLLEKKIITKRDLQILKKYLEGNTLSYLKIEYPDAKARLDILINSLEHEIGYLDEIFLEAWLREHPKYRIIKQSLLELMQKRGRNYDLERRFIR